MKTIFTFIAVIFLAYSAAAQQPDSLKYCLNNQNVGVGGYDPVSYFGRGPVAGKNNFNATYENVTYLFASENNRKKFVANPGKYLPQFGGWCSMTLAMGRATRPTYDNYVITDSKLYLFERTLSVNGRELWLKDPQANEKIASSNYASYRATGKIK